MKFTKRQKDIIRCIKAGKAFNIITYLQYFQLGEIIQYDCINVSKSFDQDFITKAYYCNKGLPHKRSNLMTEELFIERVHRKEVNPENYDKLELSLSYSLENKSETIDGVTYEFDFYKGVYVAKHFDDIIEFLSLWQYLKSEMLVLDVPCELTSDAIGLFYEKVDSP